MEENTFKVIFKRALITKIYNKCIQLNTKKANNAIEKQAKALNRHFSKEYMKTNMTNEVPPHSARMNVIHKLYIYLFIYIYIKDKR